MFFSNPRKHPSLPQDNTPDQKKKREKQLAQAQSKCQWNLDNPNVKGVPMAKKVPNDAKPTLAWNFTVAKAGFPILENLIENRRTAGALIDVGTTVNKFMKAIGQLIPGEHGVLAAGTSSFLKKLLTEYQDTVDENLDQLQAKEGLKAYEEQFKEIPLPEIASTFKQDDVYARMRVAGPNPMLLSRISELPDNFPVTDAGFQSVMGEGDSLSGALTDKRVFILNYEALMHIVKNPGSKDKQVFAPLGLFALNQNRSKLIPVAIQCGQDSQTFPIAYGNQEDTNGGSDDYWRWLVAKTILQMSEGNYHELYVHLARTHLINEAFAVATKRYLADIHPINILLTPHFEGTLSINNSAAGSLIAAGGPIDDIFGGNILAVQQAAGGDRLNYDFYENMLPQDFKKRGVDDQSILPEYPYRDDALLVWNAIHEWVVSYIAVYYMNDDAIKLDTELVQWTNALMSQDEGKIKGFKPITSRSQLADVLTIIIFNGSAQHAAVNFPQKSLMSFAPAISGAVWGAKPEDGKSLAQWRSMLPPLPEALQQVSLLQLLGGVYYRRLGEYKNNKFPYCAWFGDKTITKKGGPLDQFNQALSKVESTINERNKSRDEYTFLLPSNIPPSINI